MPYSERLTWGGVALHAGGLPGYPSSHGCVHLPSEFARQLFGITHHAYTLLAGGDAQHPRWSTVGLPDHAAESRGLLDRDAADCIQMPGGFSSHLNPIPGPGATMPITDVPVLEHRTGPSLSVMGSGLPPTEPVAASHQVSNRRAPAPVESVLVN